LKTYYYKDDLGRDRIITSVQIVQLYYESYLSAIRWFGILPLTRGRNVIQGQIHLGKSFTKNYVFLDETVLKKYCINDFVQTFLAYEISGDFNGKRKE
jgi:hypothetical protein